MKLHISLPSLFAFAVVAVSAQEFVRAADPDQVWQLLGKRDCYACDLSSANLRGKFLKRAYLRAADLRWANLSRAYMPRSILVEAQLQNAYLVEANLQWSDLRGADLSRANLVGVDLRHAYLRNVNFEGADLTEAQLGGARLEGAIFCNTIMPGGAIANQGCLELPSISIGHPLLSKPVDLAPSLATDSTKPDVFLAEPLLSLPLE